MEQIDISGREKEAVSAPAQKKRISRRQLLKRRRRRRMRVLIVRLVIVCLVTVTGILLGLLGWKLTLSVASRHERTSETAAERREFIRENTAEKPAITEAFLTPNPYSRPGEPLEEVNSVFVHYTANRGTSAAQNRSYFENLGTTGETSASAHFVIGYEGEIIQCLPLDEIGYAVKTRNYDSISIECCYLSGDGSFTEETYQSLLELTAWLLREYKLTPADVLRHYDVGGKKCPLYYVENEDSWEQFKVDLAEYIRNE